MINSCSDAHLKWSWPSGSLVTNRFKICSSRTVQVWNLPMSFFPSETRLKYSHIDGSLVASQVVIITESISVEPSLSEYALRIYPWTVPRTFILPGLSKVLTRTELKSVSLRLCRFETCRQRGTFSIGTRNTPQRLISTGLSANKWSLR
jgi:hypothetical protein